MIDHTLLKHHNYGLVAAEQLETLPEGIKHKPLSTGILEDSAALMPSLIELGQLDEAKSLELLELMNSQINDDEMPVVSTLINTDYDLKRINSYFARIQICSSHQGERAWLRVHDSKVWAQLERALKPATFAKIAAPIKTWTMYYGQEWVSQTLELKGKGDQIFTTLLLDGHEWAALERIGIVNRSLQKLNLNSYEQCESCSESLNEIVARAQSVHNLNRTDDLVRYVCLSWNSHLLFDTHPIAINAIAQYKQQLKNGEVDTDDSSVVSAFETLAAADWNLIRKELNSETNKTTG